MFPVYVANLLPVNDLRLNRTFVVISSINTNIYKRLQTFWSWCKQCLHSAATMTTPPSFTDILDFLCQLHSLLPLLVILSFNRQNHNLHTPSLSPPDPMYMDVSDSLPIVYCLPLYPNLCFWGNIYITSSSYFCVNGTTKCILSCFVATLWKTLNKEGCLCRWCSSLFRGLTDKLLEGHNKATTIEYMLYSLKLLNL